MDELQENPGSQRWIDKNIEVNYAIIEYAYIVMMYALSLCRQLI
jgi:hypothetical protein